MFGPRPEAALWRLPADLWSRLRGRLTPMAELGALFYRLLRATFSGAPGGYLVKLELGREIYLTGVRGGPVVALTALVLGLLVIVHATRHLARFQGEEYIGQLLVLIVIREVGPLLTAFFVILRSGTAITVELGSLALTRELEVLEMLGLDPDRVLGLPRFWGLTISLVALYLLSLFTAIPGGYFFAQFFADIYWQGFWLSFLKALDWPDLAIGLGKAFFFGLLIGTVSVYYGLQGASSLRRLPRQTSQAAVLSLILCGAVNALLDVVYYL